MTNYTVSLKSNVTVANGGMLTVNLYKMSQYFIEFFSAANISNISYNDINTNMVMNWTQPKGEIIVIQKPSNSLQVDITVDKTLYSPGDAVNYAITVKDRKTKKLVTDRQVLISVTATDESVFAKIEDRKLPPSLGAAVYLENEVKKISNELYYSNQYIDHWFQSAQNADANSNDRNLELLLGVQGWRSNFFDLRLLSDTVTNFESLSEADQTARQQLLSKVQKKQVYYNDVMYEMAPMMDMAPMMRPVAKAAGGD